MLAVYLTHGNGLDVHGACEGKLQTKSASVHQKQGIIGILVQ